MTQVTDSTDAATHKLQGSPLDAEALFRCYGPMVVRRCRHLLRDPLEAQDIAQEVFLRVVEKSADLSGEYPSSLLWRMATNLCLNRIRDRGRRGEGEDGDLVERIAAIGDVQAQYGARSVLDRLFGRHPESSRTIAVLHLHDGMSLEETAAEVGLSVSGVRKRLRALRSTLIELEAV